MLFVPEIGGGGMQELFLVLVPRAMATWFSKE